MTDVQQTVEAVQRPAKGPLIYRQSIFTRLTHWVWAVCLFFLLLSGLNIFNARPQLYIGQESGFGYNNTILEIGSEQVGDAYHGFLTVFGHKIDTTGIFGISGPPDQLEARAFPRWATIPSYYDLGTSRVVHFFFGWIFLGVVFVWFLASAINGHIWRDLIPKPKDVADLPRDLVDHATLHLKHTRSYSPLQKLAYFAVFFILFPLIILTGLTMSPGMDSALHWLLDLFGGRQTARTIHFTTMSLLVLFFVVHIIMVILAGPINELRSMITGWYRISPETAKKRGE
jgi:thiosulfate reductase cytochrome b subunit